MSKTIYPLNIDPELKTAAIIAARNRGESLAAVIRRAIQTYVDNSPQPAGLPPWVSAWLSAQSPETITQMVSREIHLCPLHNTAACPSACPSGGYTCPMDAGVPL